MKKILLVLLVLSLFISCGSRNDQIIDVVHKTFYVNGVSAIDGYDAVYRSLQDVGFSIDKEGVKELDLTIIGEGFSYYANHYADNLTDSQVSKQTGGLFEDLPSKAIYSADEEWRVYLSWYATGEVNKCIIECGWNIPLLPEDALEVNKRLAVMFPHSKIGNSRFGYKVYYDDNGVELYFTDSFRIEIEKKQE